MKKETHGTPQNDAEDKEADSGKSGADSSAADGVLQETDLPNKEGKADKKEDTRKIRSRRSQSNVCYVSGLLLSLIFHLA